MNNREDVEILPEDRVQLNKDQKNLILLALEKQLPPEDAEFLEKIKKDSKKDNTDSYVEISEYYIKKYGDEFGRIYLATITGGEKSCKNALDAIERA